MTHAREKLAAAKDNDRERLARLGVSAGGAFGVRVRAATIRAMQTLRSPQYVAQAAAAITNQLAPVVAQAMTAAYLTGVQRAHQTAAAAIKAKGGGRPTLQLAADPYASALKFVQDRLDASNQTLTAIADTFGPQAATATGQLATLLESKVAEAVRDSVAANEHVAAGIARIREAFDAAGVTTTSNHTVETLFRTQTAIAYSAGQQHANAAPAIDDILWGYEYSTVGDDRVRMNHAALDGTRLPKDDPRWRTIMPPCGYNCRCTVVEIYKGDPGAESTGLHPRRIDGELIIPQPDPGWAFNPAEVFAALAT